MTAGAADWTGLGLLAVVVLAVVRQLPAVVRAWAQLATALGVIGTRLESIDAALARLAPAPDAEPAVAEVVPEVGTARHGRVARGRTRG